MEKLLKYLLICFGLVCIAIPVSIIAFGVQSIANMFAGAFAMPHPVPGLGSINTDSELRFYSVFFAAYGAVCIQTGHDLARHINRVPWISGLFLCGGLARLLSALVLGAPHPLFLMLLGLELALPLVFFGLWAKTRGRLT